MKSVIILCSISWLLVAGVQGEYVLERFSGDIDYTGLFKSTSWFIAPLTSSIFFYMLWQKQK